MAPFSDINHTPHIQTDSAPTAGSTNFLTSGVLHTALNDKQEALTISNNASSSLNGVFYPLGGLNLTGNILTYVPQIQNKVYYHAELTNDITYSNNIYATPQDVTGMTLHGESHSGSYDTTTGIFTAPRSGLYYVDFTILVEDHVGTKGLFECVSRIDYKPVGGGSFTQHTGQRRFTNAVDHPIVNNTVSTAIHLNSGDQIKNVFQITYDSDSNTAHGTRLLAAYLHPTQSARHSLRGTRQSVFSID